MRHLITAVFLITFSGTWTLSAQQVWEVSLRHTSFTPSTTIIESRNLNLFLAAQEAVDGRVHCWMQFSHVLSEQHLSLLKNRDIRLQGYVRPFTYLVSIPAGGGDAWLRDLPIRGIHAYEPEHKADGNLLPYLLDDSGKSERVEAFVFFHEDISGQSNAERLEKHNLRPHIWYSDSTQARLFLPSEKVRMLATLPHVRYLEIAPGPGEPDDQWARAIHRNGLIHQPGAGAPLTFDGSGVRVLVRDDGRVGPHIDYQGRLNQDYSYRPELDGTHGDMVAGIVSGANNLQPFAQGMAPGSLLYIEDYRGDFPNHTTSLIDQEGIAITNSSYSDGCNTGYTGRTVRVDQQIFTRPHLMHVFSAGNAGTNDCDYGAGPFWGNITGGHKAGKNSIATANLFSDYGLVNSSSRGPVFDGRIKPDISAHGQGQLTTFPFHTINEGGGTSAAAPGVAGVMAQLYQVYEQHYSGEPVPSALIKAALLATATDLGQPGPDFIYGWGHLNGFAAHNLLVEGRFESITVEPGEVHIREIVVPPGLAEARVMLYWVDPPAMPQATKALINDFDLRVQNSGGGNILLPLVLDHTPDPFKLNQPAQPGIDRINNMEQVRIPDPAAGFYEVQIEGFELPFGVAEVWLVYEFLYPEPILAYPVGGESLRPQQTTRVYWEAARNGGPWQVDFSADGGNSWINLQSNVAPALRQVSVTIPNVTTNQGYIRLSRDGESITHERPIHVLREPGAINVVRACPDTLYLDWSPVADIQGYDVFTLGEKYMEIHGSTDTNYYVIPIWNPLAENWMALRSSVGDSIYSERTNATLYNAGLRDCKQPIDLRGVNVASPFKLELIRCEPDSLPIIVSIRNEGSNAVSNVPIYYQIGDKDPVEGLLAQSINPNAVRFYKLVPEPFFDESGLIPIKIWSDMPGEAFRYNDTIYAEVDVRLLSADLLNIDFVETFEGLDDWPPSWFVIDENNDGFSWELFRVGLGNDDTTTVAVMGNYFYDQIGERDVLVTPLVDLPVLSIPRLQFDVAYSGLAGQGADSLLVLLSTSCGETIDKIVYAKSGTALITIEDSWMIHDPFVPSTKEEWRTEEIDLSDFAGQRIQLRFVNVAGFNNNIWLNNISVIDKSNDILTARFNLPEETVCVGDSLELTSISTGLPDHEFWNFGVDALPASASGAGPHWVTYSAHGIKTILLEVSRDTLTDAVSQLLEVIPLPDAAFEVAIAGDTLHLISSPGIPFSQDFTWLVDDVFAGSGPIRSVLLSEQNKDSIRVQLTACNFCGCDTRSQTILLTSLAPPTRQSFTLHLHPNPGSDLIQLSGELPSGDLNIEVMDMAGRVIWQARNQWQGGSWTYPLEVGSYVAGAYLIRVISGGHYQQILFIKE